MVINHKGLKILLTSYALSFWGCLIVYNVDFQYSDPRYFASRQLLWLTLAFAPAFIILHTSAQKILKSLPWLALLALIALIGLFFSGETINGMRGWYNMGSFQIQPSEITKPIFCLGLGFCLYKKRESRGFIWGCAWLLCFVFLIAIQPDFGSLLVYLLTFLFFYIFNGGKWRYILMAFVPFFLAAFAAYQKYAYIRKRIAGFLYPEQNELGSSYHLIQIKKALAHGDWFGQPYGRNFISEVYVPLSRNDSVFALLGESIGFISLTFLMGIFLAGAIYLLKNNHQPKNSFQFYAISALVFQIITQAYLHMSVNIGLLPMTGITLPFFSYGGSSLTASIISMALIGALSKKEAPIIQTV